MKTVNAIKKLEKNGFKVRRDENRITARIEGNSYYIKFLNQNDYIICLGVENFKDPCDAMTDYFPVYWMKSITKAINFVKN